MSSENEYIKQLENALEKMQERFECVYKEVEGAGREFWYDLKAILPFQEGQKAFSLVYEFDKNVNQQTVIGGVASASTSPFIGLTMKHKTYINGTVADDIVTIGEVYDVLYAKPSYCKFEDFTRLKRNSSELLNAEDTRRMMYKTLLKASSKVALETRRGAGNIVVLSEEVGAEFSKLEQFSHATSWGGDTTRGFRIQKIGTIGRFDVLVDYKNKTNKAIVIYRGSKENDGCGCILNNGGIRHWYRPDNYEKYWNTIDIT
jgi:hypothetical protein